MSEETPKQPSLLLKHDLSPAVRAAGDEYASFAELVSEEDITEYDLRVPWWGNRWIRLRGLSTDAEAAIERAGRLAAAEYRKANPEDQLAPASNWRAEYIEALVQGFVSPRLNVVQAEQLLEKNARGIDEIVRFVRMLNRLNYDAIRNYAESLADARTADPESTE